MARVTARSEYVASRRGRVVATEVSRYALFDVLCRAVDVLASLPDEIREDFATIILDAQALGWVELPVPSASELVTRELAALTDEQIVQLERVLNGLTPADDSE